MPAESVSVIPGNHDVYTRGAQREMRFSKFFARPYHVRPRRGLRRRPPVGAVPVRAPARRRGHHRLSDGRRAPSRWSLRPRRRRAAGRARRGPRAPRGGRARTRWSDAPPAREPATATRPRWRAGSPRLRRSAPSSMAPPRRRGASRSPARPRAPPAALARRAHGAHDRRDERVAVAPEPRPRRGLQRLRIGPEGLASVTARVYDASERVFAGARCPRRRSRARRSLSRHRPRTPLARALRRRTARTHP